MPTRKGSRTLKKCANYVISDSIPNNSFKERKFEKCHAHKTEKTCSVGHFFRCFAVKHDSIVSISFFCCKPSAYDNLPLTTMRVSRSCPLYRIAWNSIRKRVRPHLLTLIDLRTWLEALLVFWDSSSAMVTALLFLSEIWISRSMRMRNRSEGACCKSFLGSELSTASIAVEESGFYILLPSPNPPIRDCYWGESYCKFRRHPSRAWTLCIHSTRLLFWELSCLALTTLRGFVWETVGQHQTSAVIRRQANAVLLS